MNDRRKSSRTGKEEYFREEVNGKRSVDDWEDICFAVGNLDPIVAGKIQVAHFSALPQMVSVMGHLN